VVHLEAIFQSDDWDDREVWGKYVSHVLKVIRVGDKGGSWEGEECRLGFWGGRCLQVEGRVPEAVEVLEHVVKVHETTLAENHPDRLASQHALAIAYRANGQVKEAIELLKHVVSIKSQIMAPTHPSRQVSEEVLSQIRIHSQRIPD